MLQHLVLQLAAASVLVAAAPGAFPETPPQRTPTTRILAIGTFAPGTDMQLVQRTLAAEARATAKLYLEGMLDRQSRSWTTRWDSESAAAQARGS